MLNRRSVDEITNFKQKSFISDNDLKSVQEILNDCQQNGESALRKYAEKFGDLQEGQKLFLGQEELERAYHQLEPRSQEVLQRTKGRIQSFSQAQLGTLQALSAEVDGGLAGHSIEPIEIVGCYAPGGRYPLPSSVLMTAVPARVAGVERVVVASPRPSEVTLAAAHVAEADSFLVCGGAQAIAALAFGIGQVPKCDFICGPGNKWVTAAKKLLFGKVGIDMLAGPSELAIIADNSSDPSIIAADLLAQAEHDADALVALIALDEEIIDAVNRELSQQLETLSTKDTALESLKNSVSIFAKNNQEAIEIANSLASEHLQVMTQNPNQLVPQLKHYGALFIGTKTAEVFGDYGAGPNHVLPTGSNARFSAGLSVFSFLRIRSWLQLDHLENATNFISDVSHLARLEGLEAHARAAEIRKK